MRKACAVLPLIVAAAGCGTMNVSRLGQGMTADQVTAVFGQPKQISEGYIGADRIEAWDYARDSWGIPNPIDDYWWIIPPSTNVTRVWFLNGAVRDFQTTKVRHIDQLKTINVPPEWRTPPDFRSPSMPSFITELVGKVGR
ncbi:MAG: hypothetical protein PHN82_05435 [bacterium]|nr:hypothetical protein [bacterium]